MPHRITPIGNLRQFREGALRQSELVDVVIVEARDVYKVALDLAGCDHKASLDGTNDISRRVDIGCGQAALSFRPREFLPATAPESSHPNTRLSGKILVDCQRNFASSV